MPHGPRRTTSKIPESLAKVVIAELKVNREHRETLQMEPLKPSIIRNAIEKAGNADKGVRALIEAARAENAKLQARVEAGDRGPDQHGRIHGQENYGKSMSDEQWSQMTTNLSDIVAAQPVSVSIAHEKPSREPRNLDEAIAQLSESGLLAPTGSQISKGDDPTDVARGEEIARYLSER